MRCRKLFQGLAMLLITVAFSASAKVTLIDPSDLSATDEQRKATELITHFLRRYHYRKHDLDDAQSEHILRRYIESLDPNRSYFLASDIHDFNKYKHRLDDALRDAKLDTPFRIFKRFRKRLEKQVKYAQKLLTKEFDFTIDEYFPSDRSEHEWAGNSKELNEVWRKKIKNDALNLTLSGKSREEIVDTLTKRYQRLADRIGQFDSDDIYQSFINSYAATIEPHTSYFSKRASDNFKIRMSLSLEGIGAALQSENDYTVVRRIIPGGPAALGNNLHQDDRIVGVGQGEGPLVDVVGWRLSGVVDLIRGPKGTKVRLEVLPKGALSKTKIISIERNQIKLEEQAAQSEIVEVPIEGRNYAIAVIRVPTFYTDFEARERGIQDFRSTTRDVRRILRELRSKNIMGIVIDLRGNGGGSLAEATELTGLFIKSGPIVQVRDSTGRISVNDDPDPEIAYAGPLAVLVDRHSASASEIFAGALQDYRRGIVIGEPTFGKGTVQRLVDLGRFTEPRDDRMGQLKFTIAQFFRINGDSTQHRGVVPDIVFPTVVDVEEQGERSLDNALPWASVRPANYAISAIDMKAIDEARARHQQRIKDDPGFGYLIGEANALKEAFDRKTVSLLEERRRITRDMIEKKSLDRLNKYRRSVGLSEFESLDDQDPVRDPNEKTEADTILRYEAAFILMDMIKLQRQEHLMTLRDGDATESAKDTSLSTN